jgi:hypothetical protein
MAKVIHTRQIQPMSSPGFILGAVLLVIFWRTDNLNIWTVLLCLAVIPILNVILVGRTHREELVIEKTNE